MKKIGCEYRDETIKKEKRPYEFIGCIWKKKVNKINPQKEQDSDGENEIVSMMKKIMSRNDELLKEMKLMKEKQKKYSDQIKSPKRRKQNHGEKNLGIK
ncbi:hypothetical protein ILUMI_06094 [Ignelater luminosus]|uniref:Uncharacterized protein n=1 Tax=Ignelater luminosus TaxID=2038154 RepID=A0A8K0DB03_IGNLU|nr:hypothetical protein ILUMI_06094 [Ignelater luminosus]